jgi:cytochrome c6
MPLDGKGIYRQRCVICHGADGSLGLNGAGNLTQSILPLNERVTQITKGKNLMPAFEGVLTPEEILAVATFTETLKK